MKLAILFPGQGSQSVGMLSQLATENPLVNETFSEASDVLGFDLWALTQNGPDDELNQTENTQPAMLAADVACWRVWRDLGGPIPTHTAGHSLGEYAALVAAGSLSFSAAIGLVALRGRLMQTATPNGVGAMAAVLGIDDDVLESLCAEHADEQVVSCANYNAPGQIVIAGHREAVDRVCEAAKNAGARRALPLPVSVPSHCLLMREASAELLQELDKLPIETPEWPVIHNADVQSHDSAGDIRGILSRQLWQPVRWTQSINALAASGCDQFVECGPGRVLAGLNKRINRELKCSTLADTAAMTNLITELNS